MTNTKMTAELFDELRTGARYTAEEMQAMESYEEPPCCSICDGQGHGYPGAGPCPLENTMSFEDVEREDWEHRNLS
jgi:hypothetical protein